MGKVIIPASMVATLCEHKARQLVDVKQNKEEDIQNRAQIWLN